MTIAIASDKETEEGKVSTRAARAPYYLLYDAEEHLTESLKNPFAIGGGGAGFSVAKMLADRGVDTLIAGEIGGNMTGALDERGIRHIERSGSVTETLQAVVGNG